MSSKDIKCTICQKEVTAIKKTEMGMEGEGFSNAVQFTGAAWFPEVKREGWEEFFNH